MFADRLLATLFLCALTATAVAEPAAPSHLDEVRSGWRYRRAVTVKDTQSLTAVALPPEVRADSAVDLRDLRLLREDSGQEVPFLIEEQTALREERRAAGELVDTRSERRENSVWLVDLKSERTFASVSMRIEEQEFVKRLKIEAGPGRQGPFRVIAEDYGIFDRVWPWAGDYRLHHGELVLQAPTRARFLRITADDRRSAPIQISGVEVRLSRNTSGIEWSREATLEPLPPDARGQAGTSAYRLNLPRGYPIESLELVADDAIFARRIAVRERHDDGKADGRSDSLGQGMVYRYFPFQPVRRRFNDMLRQIEETEDVPSEMRSLRLSKRPGMGEIIIEVEDGDSPPLRNLRAVVSGTSTRLVVPLSSETARAGSTLWLYYGNSRARAPQYDLESLRGHLSGLAGLPLLHLGNPQQNPRFAAQPPLAFVATVGAALEVQGHKVLRRMQLSHGKGEDIYGFSLFAEDLALLQPTFADLRIVDGEDRQVPYVLSLAESERSLPMEPRGAPSARVSRYALELPKSLRAATGSGAALPISAVDIQIKDPLFSRPVRLLVPLAERPGEERVIFSGQLSRKPLDESEDAEPPPSVMRVPLLVGSQRALLLEIDNQDNAPLQIERVSAVVAVPRVAFKLKPQGSYRVLYGASELSPPHYDIELLRRAVLDYAAVPVELGELEANPGYRVRTADYLREAPPTLIVWLALGFGVVVLLGLTVRLLRNKDTDTDAAAA
jgi:hypothetical protein